MSALPAPTTDVGHWLDRSMSDVAAECDQIRSERGLPDTLLFALLDDISEVAGKSIDFSCNYKRIVGLKPCNECGQCATRREQNRQSHRREAERKKARRVA